MCIDPIVAPAGSFILVIPLMELPSKLYLLGFEVQFEPGSPAREAGIHSPCQVFRLDFFKYN